MSDYVGALMRSAGFGAAPPRRSQPVAADDDPFEPSMGAEPFAGAEPIRAEDSPTAGAPTAATRDGAPPDVAGAVDPYRRKAPLAPEADRLQAERAMPRIDGDTSHAGERAPPPPHTPSAALHPVVRAALRWVAADPAAQPAPPNVERPVASRPLASATRADAPDGSPPRAASLAAPALPPRRPAAGPGPAPHQPHAPHAPHAVELRPAATPGRASAANAPQRAGIARLPAATPATAKDLPPPAPEVHIGSIHVTVDAPRAAPPPAAPPARPATATRAASTRSAYLRSRAPRI